MKKILAAGTSALLVLAGTLLAFAPAHAVGADPTLSVATATATEDQPFTLSVTPTYSNITELNSGTPVEMALNTSSCDALPAGLTWNYTQSGSDAPTLIEFAGTPQPGTAGSYSICFDVTYNPDGVFPWGTSSVITLTVEAGEAAATFISVPDVSYGYDRPVAESTFFDTNAPAEFTIEIGTMPAGLTATWLPGNPFFSIEGRPTLPGTYVVPITLTDGTGPVSGTWTITITPPSNGSTPRPYCSETTTVNETTAYWDNYDECEAVSDAGTTNTGDAYDSYGYFYTVDADNGEVYYFQADTNPEPNVWVDESVWSQAENAYVDVVMSRSVNENTVTWTANAYLQGTDDPADIDMNIDGGLGSDEDTIVQFSNGYTVTSDNADGDPYIIWVPNGGTVNATEGDGDVSVTYGDVSTAKLQNILLGYECSDSDAINNALNTITDDIPAYINQNIVDVTADCSPSIVSTDPVDGSTFTNGVDGSLDWTITPGNAIWDWTYGGNVYDVTGLPNGLDWDDYNDWAEDGTLPTINVYGTADDEPGDYTVTYTLEDDNGNSAEGSFVITVVNPTTVLSLELDAEIGDLAEGSPVNYGGSNLQAGSDWSLTLYSDPVVLASGQVDELGLVSGTVELPAGISAGWHRIVLEGVDFEGNTVSSTVWVEITASGTIAAIQTTEPVIPDVTPAANGLALTGSNVLMTGLLSAGMLALGALVVALAAMNRRKENN